MFDFGFGLSYTTFAYSNLDISGKGTSLKVSCDVTNTGTRVGKEIVELYIVNPLSDIMRAKRELKGFVKVELQPNETKKVDFVLDDRSFSIFDTEENKFVVVDGEYGIQLSASLNDVRLETKVSVKGKLYTRNDRLTYPSYFAPINGSFVVTDEEFVSLSGQKIINDTKINKGDFTIHDSLGDVMQVSRFTRFVVNKIASMGLKKSSKSEVEQTLSYSMETPLDSLITMSNGILTENMAYGVVDIGNGRFFSGLRKILSKNKTNNR
ncbi:MAG: fibronectin type III-like domain-contianing protein [Clostridia bacterium]